MSQFILLFQNAANRQASLFLVVFFTVFLSAELSADVLGREFNGSKRGGKIRIEVKSNLNLCGEWAKVKIHLSSEFDLVSSRKNIYAEINTIFSNLQKRCNPPQQRLFASIYFQDTQYFQVTAKNTGSRTVYKENWSVNQHQTLTAIKSRIAQKANRKRDSQYTTAKPVDNRAPKSSFKKLQENNKVSKQHSPQAISNVVIMALLIFLILLAILIYRKKSNDHNEPSIDAILNKWGNINQQEDEETSASPIWQQDNPQLEKVVLDIPVNKPGKNQQKQNIDKEILFNNILDTAKNKSKNEALNQLNNIFMQKKISQADYGLLVHQLKKFRD